MIARILDSSASSRSASFARLAPGVALCAAISAGAYAIELGERAITGHPYVEALVLAILLGAVVRNIWAPSKAWTPGIAFSAKTLLEIAVMLLGASLSAAALAGAGVYLLVGIVVIVIASLTVSYSISRLLGLSPTMSLLIASGNSICGNSAIAAVASVIRADGDDVASSIAFTAILGVIVILILPLAVPLLGINEFQYGTLAGLTVYAVPQVLAATVPVSALSAQVGTIVKLVRVMMLGPLVMAVALAGRKRSGEAAARLPFFKLVPWFVIGFAVLSIARSSGLVPDAVLPVIQQVSLILTVLSMAALGLGVDLGNLRRVGGRATAAVCLSILALTAMASILIMTLPL
jgi:uncharacterized integral membrane protein (TIGR00698 family)